MHGDDVEKLAIQDSPGCSSVDSEQVGVPANELPKTGRC
jgi:hypothetical protein